MKAEYEKLAWELMGRKDVNFFHFNVDLAQGPCVIKRLRGCGAGCEYVAITPDGDIYPCHQFVGKEEYRMGNVYDGSFDMEISGKFADQNIYTRPACRECWARFYCSGGCSASNLLVNGDISQSNEVACEMERKRPPCGAPPPPEGPRGRGGGEWERKNNCNQQRVGAKHRKKNQLHKSFQLQKAKKSNNKGGGPGQGLSPKFLFQSRHNAVYIKNVAKTTFLRKCGKTLA